MARAKIKFDYYADTDSLHIDLSEKPSVESEEATPGIALDFDEKGKVAWIWVSG